MLKKQNYYIDFLRFIFSLIIVFYHSWIFKGVFHTGYFNRGYYAVDFYFIVTGYLLFDSICRKFKKKSVKDSELGKVTFKFVFDKIKGLLPYIGLSIILGLIFIHLRDFSLSSLLSDNVVAEVLQLSFLEGKYSINTPLWYISVMIIVLFILFPLLLKYRDNYVYFIAFPLIIFVIGLTNYMGININSPSEVKFIFINGFYKGMIFINLGIISYSVSRWIESLKLKKKVRIILTIFETLGYLFLILAMHYHLCDSYVFGLGFTILVSLTFSGQTLISGIFKSSFWKRLGKFGFVLYLNNYYFIYFIKTYYNYSYNNLVIIYLVHVFIISILSYILIDGILPKIIQKK